MIDLPDLRDLLQPIVGQPLSGMWRAVGQVFEFGEQRPDTNRRGEAIMQGDFLLKFIAADWRVIQADRLILGSSDHSSDDRFFDSEEPSECLYESEAWRLGRDFLQSVKERKFVAESIEVGKFADVTVHLSNNLLIQSFGSSGQDLDLWWFLNRCTDVSCLVGPSGHNQGARMPHGAPGAKRRNARTSLVSLEIKMPLL
jgi:hypothetical protein